MISEIFKDSLTQLEERTGSQVTSDDQGSFVGEVSIAQRCAEAHRAHNGLKTCNTGWTQNEYFD